MRTTIEHSISKEKMNHSSVLVPYSLYNCIIPDLFANVPMHWHEEFEINYVVEGNGQILIDGETYTVATGDLLIIPPNTLHAAFSQPEQRLHYKALVFSHALLGTESKDRSSLYCIYPLINGKLKINYHIAQINTLFPSLYEAVTDALTCANESLALSDLLLKSSLLKMFYYIEKESSFIEKEDSNPVSGDSIRPALSFMESHYSEPITIENLANCCNLSPSYFMSCFKKIAGISAMEHLTQLRILNACETLINTNATVAEIALNNGFLNLSNFNRMFKKHVGTTPSEYRKMNMFPPLILNKNN